MADKVFGAYVTNLGKYAEGHLVGEWVGFPTTREEMKGVFDRIGINEDYQEVFITDYDIDIYGMKDNLGEYENLDKLNYLAAVIANMEPYERKNYEAVMESGITYGEPGIDDLINLAFNLDGFDIYPEISDEYDLGVYCVSERYREVLGKLGELRKYIDYEAFGSDTQINDGGMFTDKGYVIRNDESWNWEYDGSLERIPYAYRVLSDNEENRTPIFYGRDAQIRKDMPKEFMDAVDKYDYERER